MTLTLDQARQRAIETVPADYAGGDFPLRYRSDDAYVFGCEHPDGQRRTGGVLIWVDRTTGSGQTVTFPQIIAHLATLEAVSSDE